MADFKIIEISNLIPVRVKCSLDGEIQTIFGYIDYSTNEVFAEELPQGISLDDFKSSVIKFLFDWEQENLKKLEDRVPQEAYDQIPKKPKLEDYLPKNLPEEFSSVRLKESDGKN